MQGYGAGLADGTVLELPALPGQAVIAPVGVSAWLGVGQDHLSPAVCGEVDEIVAAQVNDLFGSQMLRNTCRRRRRPCALRADPVRLPRPGAAGPGWR